MMMMMMNGDVLVPTNPDRSGKWPLKLIKREDDDDDDDDDDVYRLYV